MKILSAKSTQISKRKLNGRLEEKKKFKNYESIYESKLISNILNISFANRNVHNALITHQHNLIFVNSLADKITTSYDIRGDIVCSSVREDGKIVICATSDNYLLIFDSVNKFLLRRFKLSSKACHIDINNNDVLVNLGHKLTCYSMYKEEENFSFTHKEEICFARYFNINKENLICFATRNKKVYFMNTFDQSIMYTIEAKGIVNDVQFDSKSNLVNEFYMAVENMLCKYDWHSLDCIESKIIGSSDLRRIIITKQYVISVVNSIINYVILTTVNDFSKDLKIKFKENIVNFDASYSLDKYLISNESGVVQIFQRKTNESEQGDKKEKQFSAKNYAYFNRGMYDLVNDEMNSKVSNEKDEYISYSSKTNNLSDDCKIKNGLFNKSLLFLDKKERTNIINGLKNTKSSKLATNLHTIQTLLNYYPIDKSMFSLYETLKKEEEYIRRLKVIECKLNILKQ